MRYWVFVAIVGLTAGCGADVSPAGTTTPEPSTSTSASSATTSNPISPATDATTSTNGAATSTTPSDIDVEFSDGEVTGPDVFDVALGDQIDIWVISDVDDELHVHGYDVFVELEAGVPSHLSFLADVPGVFEVEVHTGHTRLFDIRVSG